MTRVTHSLALIGVILTNIDIAAASYIYLVESKVKNLIQHKNVDDDGIESQFNTIPSEDNYVASVLKEVNLILDDNTLYNLISTKYALGKFQMAIG